MREARIFEVDELNSVKSQILTLQETVGSQEEEIASLQKELKANITKEVKEEDASCVETILKEQLRY